MIGIGISASAASAILKSLIEEEQNAVSKVARDGKVPSTPAAFWGWVQHHERRIAVLEACKIRFDTMPPTMIVVEPEKEAMTEAVDG